MQITMLGVGVALAALIVTLNGSLRRDIDKRLEGVEKRFDARLDGIDKRLDGIEKRFDDRFDGIDARLRSVEEGLSEVKGRLALVESFILGRTEAAAGEAPAE
ncbi:MAG: hypothetical protein OXI22_00050 [Defluviicoccus sp.]|nr:hypothetical protein [Defluviicoccus sp.]